MNSAAGGLSSPAESAPISATQPAIQAVTFRRPPRANAKGNASTPEQQAPVMIGFRTHTQALSDEDFVFSSKNFNVPTANQIKSAAPGCTSTGSSASVAVPRGGGRGGSAAAAAAVEGECIIEITPVSGGGALTSPNPLASSTPGSGSLLASITKQPSAQDLGAASAPTPTASSSTNASWICRAYCGGDKHAQHAQGAISVNQRLMDVKFLSNAAKGKASARVLTFGEAQEHYGLSHAQLTIVDQFVSRSDMFLIDEALKDRILYTGQEIVYEGFRMRVSDLLRSPRAAGGAGGSSETATQSNVAHSLDAHGGAPHRSTSLPPASACGTTHNASAGGGGGPISNAATTLSRASYLSCASGLVTSDTKVNFLSLSFVYTIMIELSSDLWNPTLDGRLSMYWALDKFLKDHSENLPKFRSTPTVRFVFFGRLRAELTVADGVHDVFHTVHLSKSPFDLQRLSEIAKTHTEVLLERLCKACDEPDPRNLFTTARNSNFLQALNLVLGYYNCHHMDRRLDTTGQALTLITAGCGLYRVTNDLAQITATKMLDIGIHKCVMVCVGRPPLQTAPLFEYSSDDPTLRSQYQLQLDARARERFYQQPEWATCLFYHPVFSGRPVGSAYRFGLMTRAQWEQEFPYIQSGEHQLHPGLKIPLLPHSAIVHRTAPLQPISRRDRIMGDEQLTGQVSAAKAGAVFVRPADPTVGSVAGSVRNRGLLSATPSRTHFTLSGAVTSVHRPGRQSIPHRYSLQGKKSGGFMTLSERLASYVPFVHAKWFKQQRVYQTMSNGPCDVGGGFVHIVSSNILDADLQHGSLKLELRLDEWVMDGLQWRAKLNANAQLWEKFLRCFSSRADNLTTSVSSSPVAGDSQEGVSPLMTSETLPRHSKWDPSAYLTPARTFVVGNQLILLLRPPLHGISFDFAEEILFAYDPELFEEVQDAQGEADGDEGQRQPSDSSPNRISAEQRVSQPVAVRRHHSPHAGDDVEGSPSIFAAHRPSPGSLITIGSVQIRSSILFAIQPINPFRGNAANPQSNNDGDGNAIETETRRALDVHVTAGQVQLLRWANAHPVDPNQSTWALLCTLPLLPIYGQKPPYSPDSLCDNGRRPYWLSLPRHLSHAVPLFVKEFLLQRLHQQYQLVHVKYAGTNPDHAWGTSSNTTGRVTSAAGSSWSRRLHPLEEFELSIGHQTQVIQITEDGRGVFVQRILHKGMYESNTTHLISYNYAVLNHTSRNFTSQEVRLEAVLGGRFDFAWHELDQYLSSRSGEIPNFVLRDRQICFVLLPADTYNSGRSSSVGGDEDDGDGTRHEDPLLHRKSAVPFESFKAFITSRFSTLLRPQEGSQVDDLWQESTQPLTFVETLNPALETPLRNLKGVSAFDTAMLQQEATAKSATVSSESTSSPHVNLLGTRRALSANALQLPPSTPLHSPQVTANKPLLRAVILEHHKEDPFQCLDAALRRPVDRVTGVTKHDAFIDDRIAGADIDISSCYHQACAYIMRLSWLCCPSTIISDWTKGLMLNAKAYGLKVVQVPCVYDPMTSGNTLRPTFFAECPLHVDDATFRSNLLLRLANRFCYYPEVQEMNFFCRLIHASGLCFVLSLPSRRGIVWSENFVLKQGAAEQVILLQEFLRAYEATLHELRRS